jgi:acyl CoA:acetate/3-ketoacid CoA transferase beta subunit
MSDKAVLTAVRSIIAITKPVARVSSTSMAGGWAARGGALVQVTVMGGLQVAVHGRPLA